MEKLKTGKVAVAAIVEDGTGSGLAAFALASRDCRNPVSVP